LKTLAEAMGTIHVYPLTYIRCQVANATYPRRGEQSERTYPFTRSALATTFFARSCEMIEVRCLRL